MDSRDAPFFGVFHATHKNSQNAHPRGLGRLVPFGAGAHLHGTLYWAIAETLGMAGTAALVLAAIFALPSAYVLFIAVRMAYEAETDPANQ